MAPVTSRKLTAEFRGSGEKLLSTRLGADGISGHCRQVVCMAGTYPPSLDHHHSTEHSHRHHTATTNSYLPPNPTTTQSSEQLTPLEARDVTKSVVLWYLSLEGARG